MPNIKEIALKVAEPFLDYKKDIHASSVGDFAEALVAEIQRQSEPTYQFRPECENWIDCTPVFYESWRGEKRTVFTHPPSIEALEDKVAEACAAYVHRKVGVREDVDKVVSAIRSGEWKKFKGE